ncbi:MAG: HetZ-related protein [Trichodesmium sp. St16_bin4-tuft]|nr:HetZ-related protein [Trichodesmium sp. MAG_R01]MDE5069339.1 HetZ-related protein [Trichodesmium sp. St4_bin8_1]MDE5071714.1 HetZ-related protein [Trichodesmium sp. St5_bin8]MDE5078388.1 HetZ-related protein [Trichodesmium sp. St2_bin6]MDE5090794.1 HetZ-related protein [Trichodesmium sp. St18_bin3_1_1]MDE5099677.1 HetZ-related protein [Trichodesmium sp. St16_bin4-tuft]MDE5105216.1 HetZ-related protein [Trichodesmium sp. St19_bin2]
MTLKTTYSFNSLTNNSTTALEVSNIQVEDQTTANYLLAMDAETLAAVVLKELQGAAKTKPAKAETVALRIAKEVERVCFKSHRIQNSGEVRSWQLSLARHRWQKCLQYYKLGSKQGRIELHSLLASIIYRHIASLATQLNFQGRYNLIEDFLQGFYIESLRAFRREHVLEQDYTPKFKLELAEYMAFTEQYAKRQIGLPGRNRQRLIVLRAQGFAKGQPPETALDIEMAVESPKGEEAESFSRSYAVQQVREQMVCETVDPAEAVLRDRVVYELINYLSAAGQEQCIDYLRLRLQDYQASDIDQKLGITSRQRDYLQQRFKYHVEKFARSQNWQLVHQWLGADIDQKLGLTTEQWDAFLVTLSTEQQQILQLKRKGEDEKAIATAIKCTPKKLQKHWAKLLEMAWGFRNKNNS